MTARKRHDAKGASREHARRYSHTVSVDDPAGRTRDWPLRAEAVVHRTVDVHRQRRRGAAGVPGRLHRRRLVAAGAAGVAVALGCWPLAAVFMVLRLAGANLDGAVARARGVSRPWGFVVNEIGDRTADLLAFAGLAVWAAQQRGPGLNWLTWPVLQVLLAALAATLPTFASLAAAAEGATRRNGGPLGKTERCLFVVLAAAFPVIMPILLAQLVNGSLLTTVLRLRAAHRELKAQRTHEPIADVVPITAPITVPLSMTGAAA